MEDITVACSHVRGMLPECWQGFLQALLILLNILLIYCGLGVMEEGIRLNMYVFLNCFCDLPATQDNFAYHSNWVDFFHHSEGLMKNCRFWEGI